MKKGYKVSFINIIKVKKLNLLEGKLEVSFNSQSYMYPFFSDYKNLNQFDPCPWAGKMRIRKKLEKQFSGKLGNGKNWKTIFLEKIGKNWKFFSRKKSEK